MSTEFRRFTAKLISGNRITIPEAMVEKYDMAQGETWVFEVVQRHIGKPEVDA